MVDPEFNHDYDVILCHLSLLLDQFEKGNQLFTALCIWWLASMIRFTEILFDYRYFTIFPSHYIINCEVTPLLRQELSQSIISESDIPILDPNNNSDIAVHPSREKFLPKHREPKQANYIRHHMGRFSRIHPIIQIQSYTPDLENNVRRNGEELESFLRVENCSIERN